MHLPSPASTFKDCLQSGFFLPRFALLGAFAASSGLCRVSLSSYPQRPLADAKQIFVQMRDHVAFCASFPGVPELPFGQTAGQTSPSMHATRGDEEPTFLSLLPNPPGRLWPGFIVRDFADGAPVACLQAVPSSP